MKTFAKIAATILVLLGLAVAPYATGKLIGIFLASYPLWRLASAARRKIKRE